LKALGTSRVDEGLLLLGRAADGGKLWIGVAAVLGVSRGRFRRRAALRGLFAAGIASAMANGPVKAAVGRRRPAPGRLVRHLPGYPKPSTSSFPSGHAAVAAAFVVGAGQEVPALSAPLAGLAGLVGYSRVRSGAHHATDVAAGAALGAGAGLLTRRLWPVAPHEPAHARTALKPADVEPSPRGGGLVIVVNPSAGSSERAAEELRSELPRPRWSSWPRATT
jgi:membrane-associated phospholipid phosphatase